MQETTGARIITVRCPTHNIDFEVDSGERIVCPAGPHALTQRFPTEDFWGYCCDCHRFWPSNLNHGGKSEVQCPVCDRQIAQRYLCSSCKVVSVESDDRTVKRKRYMFTEAGGVTPACPGCSVLPTGTLHLHKCEETGAIFTTPRDVCPFCEKPTSEPKFEQKIEAKPRPTSRVKAAVGDARSTLVVDRSSTVQSKVQVPICPRCGTARRKPDDEFCGKCGEVFAASSHSPGLPVSEAVEGAVQLSGTKVRPEVTSIYPGVGQSVLAAESQRAPQKRPSFSPGLVVVLAGVGILAVALLIYFAARSRPDQPITPPISGTPTPFVNRSPDVRVSEPSPTPSKSNANSAPTVTPTPGLPDSFDRTYQGTINGKSLSLRLIKSGSELTGSAQTTKRDNLDGWIRTDGSFEVSATPVDETSPTGSFKGTVTDSTVTGYWTNNKTTVHFREMHRTR